MFNFTWAKSMDTSSAPYSEQDYPYAEHLNYGPSDYNVGRAFKLYGIGNPSSSMAAGSGWKGLLVAGRSAAF